LNQDKIGESVNLDVVGCLFECLWVLVGNKNIKEKGQGRDFYGGFLTLGIGS
jgi:hypothetical protein